VILAGQSLYNGIANQELTESLIYGLILDFLRSQNKPVNIGSDDAQRVLDNDTLKGHIHAGDLSH